MTQRATIIDTISSTEVIRQPFPYSVIKNALPDDYYTALSEAFPKLEDISPLRAAANNKRLDLLSSWGPALLPRGATANVWRSFIEDHCSEVFRNRIFNLFTEATNESETPDNRQLRLEAFGDGLLARLAVHEPIRLKDIDCRVTLAVNTPVTLATSVRGPHVDKPQKAFVGLFYLRHPEDDSEGGDLTLHRVKAGCRIEPWSKSVEPDTVEEIDVVRYAPNTLVLMLNTQIALHGVTLRRPTRHMRRLVVVSGWFPGQGRERFARDKYASEDLESVRVSVDGY